MLSFITRAFSLFFIFQINAFASWQGAESSRKIRNKSLSQEKLINELVRSGYYHSAVPVLKEYLVLESGNLNRKLENSFAKIIDVVGIKNFEILPISLLERSYSPILRYIIAKKEFRKGRHYEALHILNKIPSGHMIFPFAKNLEGVILSIEKKYERSFNAFLKCIDSSNNYLSSVKNKKRMILNRDYCQVGLARVSYAQKKYRMAGLRYLDIEKNSPIWPEILFEEAWDSYYLKNYNRTLGKLVSYKAPVFDNFFNPEAEVLTALTYLKMCLYADASFTSKRFHQKYMRDTRRLRSYLRKNRTNYIDYYREFLRFDQVGSAPIKLMKKLFLSISTESSFQNLMANIKNANIEMTRVRNKPRSVFKNAMIRNIQESILTNKKLLGSYLRTRLVSYYAQLYRSFEGMSYIKLEVLAQKKAKLYILDAPTRSRGDIKYIQRNEKQYFWNFNGEFWADELGDYVFALKSEC